MRVIINYKYYQDSIFENISKTIKIGPKLHLYRFDLDTLVSEDFSINLKNVKKVWEIRSK